MIEPILWYWWFAVENHLEQEKTDPYDLDEEEDPDDDEGYTEEEDE